MDDGIVTGMDMGNDEKNTKNAKEEAVM